MTKNKETKRIPLTQFSDMVGRCAGQTAKREDMTYLAVYDVLTRQVKGDMKNYCVEIEERESEPVYKTDGSLISRRIKTFKVLKINKLGVPEYDWED